MKCCSFLAFLLVLNTSFCSLETQNAFDKPSLQPRAYIVYVTAGISRPPCNNNGKGAAAIDKEFFYRKGYGNWGPVYDELIADARNKYGQKIDVGGFRCFSAYFVVYTWTELNSGCTVKRFKTGEGKTMEEARDKANPGKANATIHLEIANDGTTQ